MAGKSSKRKKHCSNSSSCSSDNSADPDYSLRLSKRPSRQNTFTSFRTYQRKKTQEVKDLKSSPSTSAMSGKQRSTPEKNGNKQGEFHMAKTSRVALATKGADFSGIDKFKVGRKRCFSARGNEKLKSRSNGRSEVESDQEYHGRSVSRNRNLENEKGHRKMKATIFSWLIDSKTIQENTEVFSIVENNKQTSKGTLKREGILCSCCNKIFSAADFTFHGGRRSDKPYESVYISKRQVPLLSYMIGAWTKPAESAHRRFNGIEAKSNVSDYYDDACMICADGGDLMCCEECNSTYHQICMGMEDVPRGSWHCPYCVCKFCGDPVCENDYLFECPQCEKRYHWKCHQRRELKIIDLNSRPVAPFCERSCMEVHEKLERNLVGKKNELDEGYSWTLLHRMDGDTGVYLDDAYQRTVCHSKLAVARRLMEDCFESITDRYTRINVIPSVVYNCGANFNRIQFRGFYTAVLEKDEEIISSASLRIHGTKLAEMPFIATSTIHRRKGMCKRLMIAIESALCYLNVKYLVIPSISERIGNWIEKYGFGLLDASLNKEIMCYNTLMFHDSVRLQKSLVSSHLARSGRKIAATSLQKARNNHPQNWLSFTNKAPTIASLLDLNFQPPERSKNLWMTNRDRILYR